MNLQTTFGVDCPVALVTGSAAPRVGREIAAQLAAAGCAVAIHSHRDLDQATAAAADIADRYGVATTALVGDVRQDGIHDHWTKQVADQLGRLDILVNSAAIWTPTPLEQITAKEVRRYFDINTIAPLLLARSAARIMADQPRGGAIVNLGDWATVRPYIDHAAYFPSKSAIEGMTRSLAVELSQKNPSIRVNCIQPGPVLLADDVAEPKRDQLAGSTLVGRIGTAAAVAHAVHFLCANDFVNGTCLVVDGGRQIYAPDGLQVGLNTG